MSREDLADQTVVLVADAEAGPEAGSVTPPGDARLSPLDRGFLYGDAAFETVRCYDGDPAYLPRHADRLRDALSALSIPVEPRTEELRRRVERLLDALDTGGRSADHDDAYVRLAISRGERTGVLAPTETDPTVVGIAKPLSTRRYDPATVVTVPQRRYDTLVFRQKTHNYLPSVLAKGAAGEADEALMFDDEGRVASGAGSNVFVLRDGTLSTPDRAVRPGVTREVVLELAADAGLATSVGPVESLADADGVFLTNTTWGVRPVASVDGDSVPESETVTDLRDRYLESVVG